MSSKQTRVPFGQPSESRPGAPISPRDAAWRAGSEPAPAGAAGAAEVELAIADLQGDANGEIVLFNDSGLRRMAIASDAAVVADGRAGAHRTATGHDVSGFRFLTFDNGLTLYYQSGLDVVVRAAR